MEIDRRRQQRRRAISGIVAAVILFAMLFTVGTGFFLFANAQNLFYDKSLSARNNAQQNQLAEALSLSTIQLVDGNIGVYANNTGGIGVNITAAYIQYQGKRVTTCMGVGQPTGCSTPSSTTFPSCQFPDYVNVGRGTRGIPTRLLTGGCTTLPGTLSGCTSTGGSLSSCLDTGQPANSTTAVIRVITQRGTVFAATYPQSAVSLASQALSSGAIGDLYLSFQSFTYYTVAFCAGGSGPYCLTSVGKAFQIPASTLSGGPVAFSVRVTDFNPVKANITLDKNSLIFDYWPVGSSFRTAAWYIISNTSNVISATYTPLVIYFNKPVTLIFASVTPGAFSPNNLGGSNSPPANTIAAINLVSHGWEAVSYAKILGSPPPLANYGQNMPYVSTLYT